MNKEPVCLGPQEPQFCWESRRCSFCRRDAKSAPCPCPGKRHGEVYLLKRSNQSNISFLWQKNVLVTLFLPCLLLPSFSSFAYCLWFLSGFTSMSEPSPGLLPSSFRSCIPFWLCALTRQQAPRGKLITVKSWHFLISVVGTSHQQELAPPPCLRPKHSGLQKRGRASPSDRALHAGILDVFSRLIWVTLLWNTVLMWTVQLPAARSGCRHVDRSNRLISSFLKNCMVLNLVGVGKYQLLGDRWSLIIEFLLLRRKDRSYKCCSLLDSVKGILYVQYFYISAFPPVRIWIRINNILLLREKTKWIFIFTVLDLCAFLFCAKLQPLLHSSVFIQFIAVDQCVYYIFLLPRFLF